MYVCMYKYVCIYTNNHTNINVYIYMYFLHIYSVHVHLHNICAYIIYMQCRMLLEKTPNYEPVTNFTDHSSKSFQKKELSLDIALGFVLHLPLK